MNQDQEISHSDTAGFVNKHETQLSSSIFFYRMLFLRNLRERRREKQRRRRRERRRRIASQSESILCSPVYQIVSKNFENKISIRDDIDPQSFLVLFHLILCVTTYMKCGLCDHLLSDCTVLACGHAFCKKCLLGFCPFPQFVIICPNLNCPLRSYRPYSMHQKCFVLNEFISAFQPILTDILKHKDQNQIKLPNLQEKQLNCDTKSFKLFDYLIELELRFRSFILGSIVLQTCFFVGFVTGYLNADIVGWIGTIFYSGIIYIGIPLTLHYGFYSYWNYYRRFIRGELFWKQIIATYDVEEPKYATPMKPEQYAFLDFVEKGDKKEGKYVHKEILDVLNILQKNLQDNQLNDDSKFQTNVNV